MPHIDPERLALFAIGEPVADAQETEHLAACRTCIEDLAALRHAVVAGRASIDVGELETPPEAVWDRIVDELKLAGFAPTAVEQAPETALAPPAPAPRRL